jgi:hypothetical protein
MFTVNKAQSRASAIEINPENMGTGIVSTPNSAAKFAKAAQPRAGMQQKVKLKTRNGEKIVNNYVRATSHLGRMSD